MLSDCVHCWETPCVCGYDYRNDSREFRIELASVILGIDKKIIEDGIGKYIKDVHPRYDETGYGRTKL